MAGIAGAVFLRLLGRTIWLVEPNRRVLDEIAGRGSKVILALCHGQLLLGTYFARNEGVVTIISRHRDGEYIYQIARRLGIEAVRGSSTRGGASAILRLLKAPQFANRNLGVITDGPTGPRGVVKPGIIMLSSWTGYPIVPIGIASSSRWELGSWDKFQIPRPFSSALLLLGEPMTVDGSLDREGLEGLRLKLEEKMHELNKKAEDEIGSVKMNRKWRGPPDIIKRWLHEIGLAYLGRNQERWWSLPATVLLFPLERLYALAMSARNYFYETGVFRVRKLPVPVLSVGNITVGGTGKTMLVILLSRFLARRGYNVAVLTRGYGSRPRGDSDIIRVMAGGNGMSLEAGDEPTLLARKLPECIVMRGKNRYLSGLKAIGRYGCDICILDDGFQHRNLHRDVDIVLLHRENPIGTGLLLPAGFLREGPGSLTRADLLVQCSRWGSREGETDLCTNILPLDGASVMASLVAEDIYPLGHDPEESVDGDLQGKRVLAFAGIGDPASFQKLIESLSPRDVEYRSFPDHHFYTDKSADELNRHFDRMRADVMITTEKDAVKLKTSFFDPRPCLVVSAKLHVESGWEAMEDLAAMCDVISARQVPHGVGQGAEIN